MCVAVVCIVARPAWAAAKPTTCTDVPVQVTILNSVVDPVTGAVLATALLSDGGGEYVNGTSNISATIHESILKERI
jgi:hypothetical protein